MRGQPALSVVDVRMSDGGSLPLVAQMEVMHKTSLFNIHDTRKSHSICSWCSSVHTNEAGMRRPLKMDPCTDEVMTPCVKAKPG
jgi:hypothetical protein